MLLSNLVEVLLLLNFRRISLNCQQRIDEICVFLFVGLPTLEPLSVKQDGLLKDEKDQRQAVTLQFYLFSSNNSFL